MWINSEKVGDLLLTISSLMPGHIAVEPSAVRSQRSDGIYKGIESKYVLADSYKALNRRMLEDSMICCLPTFYEQNHLCKSR